MRKLIAWLWRGSEESLGDALEEYPNKSTFWLLWQAFSASSALSIQQRKPDMLANLWADIRYAARGLRNNPGFAAAAILAIALGIGINTGIFSVLNAIALRDLPVPEASGLISIHQMLRDTRDRNTHGTKSMVSMAEFRQYRDSTKSLQALTGYSPFWEVTLGGEALQRVRGDLVLCNYFDVLQLKSRVGAGFTADNCGDEKASAVVMLGYDLWRNSFASDPAIVGKDVLINRKSLRVVGVAPEGFHGVEVIPAAFFAPVSIQPLIWDTDYYGKANTGWIQMIGRRKEGVSPETVRTDFEVTGARIAQQRTSGKISIQTSRATSFSMPEVRQILFTVGFVVMAAFGLVLLIACANVANLLLARAAGRMREVVVRAAVGASRVRLIQQLLVESGLIALAGGALGSVLAMATFRTLIATVLSSLPSQIPSFHIEPTPDMTVFIYALALTFITSLAFGLVPALHASKVDLASGMKQDTAGAGRKTTGWLRGSLVGVQVAVCMVLMIAAGLLLRGLYAAQTVDPGFEYKHVASVTFDLRGAGYSVERAGQFQTQFQTALLSIPGIELVAEANATPLEAGSNSSMFAPVGHAPFEEIEVNYVTRDFFSIIETPIVLGRTFRPDDAANRQVIVSESTARHFWPNENPLEKTLETPTEQEAKRMAWRVVGVVRDAQVTEVGNATKPILYFPSGPDGQGNVGLIVRTAGEPSTYAAAIRARAAELDAGLVVNVAPLEENLDLWRAVARLVTGLSGSLGVLALILASIGVYSVVSYAVTRRLREVGIRMVLGASAGGIRGMLLKQSLRPVFVGVVVGGLAAAAIARILESVLFGVSAHDPIAFLGAPAVLLAVTVAATLIPMRRATRVDPMRTLRYE
jgi:predicted permease